MELTKKYLEADKTGLSHMIIMCGGPRTGKTTHVNDLIDQGYVPVCRDDIRRALGVRFKAVLESQVNKYSKVMLESLLIRGVPLIVIDECNINKKARRPLIELAKKHNATWSFVEIPNPSREFHKEICQKTDFDWAIIERFKKDYEPIDETELCPKYNRINTLTSIG